MKPRLFLLVFTFHSSLINCGFTCTIGWKEKQREAKEDLNGQCQARPKGEKHRLNKGLVKLPETERSGGVLYELHRQQGDGGEKRRRED